LLNNPAAEAAKAPERDPSQGGLKVALVYFFARELRLDGGREGLLSAREVLFLEDLYGRKRSRNY
jgi:hypothetical protein